MLLANCEFLDRILDRDVLVPVLIAGGVVMLSAISALKNVLRTSARERTRREIAAYIAEGSMTPEQGERLMRSGDSHHT